MDVLTIVWQLGHSPSLFGLDAGAALVFPGDELFFGRRKIRQNRQDKNTQTAYPRASRWLSFSKGAPIGDLRFGSAGCALCALNRRTKLMARQLVIHWQQSPTRTGGDKGRR